MPRRSLPNVNWVRAVVCPAVVFIATGVDRGYQTDFWHHLARGREIAASGRVAGGVEQLTFAVAGSAVRDANWLTQLAYFRLFELGGMPLVQFANSGVLAAAAAVFVWLCRRRGGSVAVAAAAGVFAFAGIWQTLSIRPQSVSLLLFVATYAVLLEAERRRWLLVVPPALMALWANVHGGFPIGLALIGAFLAATLAERWVVPLCRSRANRSKVPVGDDGSLALPAGFAAEGKPPVGSPCAADFTARSEGSRDPSDDDHVLTVGGSTGMVPALVACLCVSVLATFANPYGARIYEYVFTLSARTSGRQVEEWLPPSMGLWVGRAWAASVVVLVLLLAFARRRPRPRDVLVALCFLPLACASVRMVPWWLLAVAPVFAGAVGRNLPAVTVRPFMPGPISRPPRASWAALAMLVLMAGAAALSTPWLEAYNPILGTLRPIRRPEADLQEVVGRMGARPGGSRVFTRLEWGEYLDWAAAPRHRAFMDGRIEIYPDDLWQQYHAVSTARADWQAILDAHGVDYLLLDAAHHAELLSHVRASARWEAAGGAGRALLFARAGGRVASADIHDAR